MNMLRLICYRWMASISAFAEPRESGFLLQHLTTANLDGEPVYYASKPVGPPTMLINNTRETSDGFLHSELPGNLKTHTDSTSAGPLLYIIIIIPKQRSNAFFGVMITL